MPKKMNYQNFFSDVMEWINACNNKVKTVGFNSNELWQWVSYSLAKLCEKYDNHSLAQAQSVMLWNWLNEAEDEFNVKKGVKVN